MAQVCPCSSRHSPPVTEWECDDHHSPPQSWPMAAGSIRRVDHLCANTHRRVHHLFNLYVHANGAPPAAVLQSFRKIERDLAAYAWTNADHSGPGHLPYTIASGIVAPEAEAEFVRLMEAA